MWLNPYCWCLNHHSKLNSRSFNFLLSFSNKNYIQFPKSLTLQSPFFPWFFSVFLPSFSMVFSILIPWVSMVLASPVALPSGLHRPSFYGPPPRRPTGARAPRPHVTAGQAFCSWEAPRGSRSSPAFPVVHLGHLGNGKHTTYKKSWNWEWFLLLFYQHYICIYIYIIYLYIYIFIYVSIHCVVLST